MNTTFAPPEPIAAPDTLRLDADCNGMSMTPEEFDAVEAYDEEFRYELIRGVLVVCPIPGDAHEEPVDLLSYLFRKYQLEHPQGHHLDRTLPGRYVFIPDGTRRIADRAVWAGLGRQPNSRIDPPTIAIEFVSVGRRNRQQDYVEKRAEYRAAGVKEYWIIDPFRRVMTVALADGTERVVAETETYTTPLLPGFTLPLADLLAVADASSDRQ